LLKMLKLFPKVRWQQDYKYTLTQDFLVWSGFAAGTLISTTNIFLLLNLQYNIEKHCFILHTQSQQYKSYWNLLMPCMYLENTVLFSTVRYCTISESVQNDKKKRTIEGIFLQKTVFCWTTGSNTNNEKVIDLLYLETKKKMLWAILRVRRKSSKIGILANFNMMKGSTFDVKPETEHLMQVYL
jgi:hypothetical protein